MSHASVYVTCPDRETARRIAGLLLERRLIACANLVPIESVYRWEGKVEEAREVAMFLKTRRERVEEVVAAVRAEHPHEVPCVVEFALRAGNPDYLGWVDAETT